jgi:hypothetical protein
MTTPRRPPPTEERPALPPAADPPPPPLAGIDLAMAALDSRAPLTPDAVAALNALYRDVVLAEDDEARHLTRRIVSRLRRATHPELHQGCVRVAIDVPQLPTGHYVMINERPFIGRCEVWACEAQTILGLVANARGVEAARLRDDGKTIDLDREGLAARARAIQAA